MSIPVTIPDLADAVEGREWAYLLTVRDDLRPHVVAVTPSWSSDRLVVDVGRGSAANATARRDITLCYPPVDEAGYSLIVDGRAEVDGQRIVFTPTGAVLHRPAPDGAIGSSTGCASDCAPVPSSSGSDPTGV